MPNRERVVGVLTQDVVGYQSWDGLKRRYRNMPTERHEHVEDAMDAIVERVARALDWDRLLTEAALRHQHLHPDHEPDGRRWTPSQGVCGQCLAEGFLSDTRGAADWDRAPVSPRRRADTDWPAAVAANLKYRTKATGHPYQQQNPTTP